MDKLAVTGIVVALFAIVGGYALEGGGISALFHGPAFLIVIGGSLGAVMLQTPKVEFIQAFKSLPLIWQNNHRDFQYRLEQLCLWADVSRQKGFLVLEEAASQETDPFVKKALMLLIDGVEQADIKHILQVDLELGAEQQQRNARVFESIGGYSPTIGILGAVLGLIQAMTNINDPTVLGQGIATAFVATIYGVGAANLLFIPMSQKLIALSQQESLYQEMILEGVLSAANGENPTLIHRKLEAYVNSAR